MVYVMLAGMRPTETLTSHYVEGLNAKEVVSPARLSDQAGVINPKCLLHLLV